jgi:hypothetical protein
MVIGLRKPNWEFVQEKPLDRHECMDNPTYQIKAGSGVGDLKSTQG